MRKYIVLVLLFAVCFISFGKEFIITYRAPESKLDTRFDYPLELIKNAMDRTKGEYGNYKLVQANNMNFTRAQNGEYISKLENFIFEQAASIENEKNLLSIKVPICKGMYGFRIMLIDKDNQKLFNKINTIEDLKKMRIGQGMGWVDVDVLKDKGFNVIIGNNYEGLFQMLLSGRFEAFSRGVNEVFHERDERIKNMPNLAIEKSICLYYPLPRYFYTAKKNKILAERLTKGLNIMIADGSFDKIWRKYNYKYMEQADFKNRKIFRIENKYIPKSVPLNEKKYWYFPEEFLNKKK